MINAATSAVERDLTISFDIQKNAYTVFFDTSKGLAPLSFFPQSACCESLCHRSPECRKVPLGGRSRKKSCTGQPQIFSVDINYGLSPTRFMNPILQTAVHRCWRLWLQRKRIVQSIVRGLGMIGLQLKIWACFYHHDPC